MPSTTKTSSIISDSGISTTTINDNSSNKNKKKKYYAVYKGRTTGIFDNWIKAQKQVNGYEGSAHESFKTKEDALSAFLKVGIKNPTFYNTTDYFDLDEWDPVQPNDEEQNTTTKSPTSSKIPISITRISENTSTLSGVKSNQHDKKNTLNQQPTVRHPNQTTNTNRNPALTPSASSKPNSQLSPQSLNKHKARSAPTSPMPYPMPIPKTTVTSPLSTPKPNECSGCEMLKETVNNLQRTIEEMSSTIKTLAINNKTQDTLLKDMLATIKTLQPTQAFNNIIELQAKKIDEILERQQTLEFQLDGNTHKVTSPRNLTPTKKQPKRKSPLLSTPKHTIISKDNSNFTNNYQHEATAPTDNTSATSTNITNTQLQRDPKTHQALDINCKTLIIGDSTTTGMRPSKARSVAIRSFPKATLSDITDQLNSMDPNNHVTDLCLATGTHDITKNSPLNSDSFRSTYESLIRTAERSFPNAYISVCGLIPKKCNSEVKADILSANDILYSLCSYSDHLKYIDMLPLFLNNAEHQNMSYYESEGFYLNKTGNILYRRTLLDTLTNWQSNPDQ